MNKNIIPYDELDEDTKKYDKVIVRNMIDVVNGSYMKGVVYKPDPVDTSGIELPDDLKILGEALAKNVHDVWAAGRIADGWTKGPRNDELKQHPCLVPYEELSEEEKDYDRRTSVETLKFIIAQGYTIVRKAWRKKRS